MGANPGPTFISTCPLVESILDKIAQSPEPALRICGTHSAPSAEHGRFTDFDFHILETQAMTITCLQLDEVSYAATDRTAFDDEIRTLCNTFKTAPEAGKKRCVRMLNDPPQR